MKNNIMAVVITVINLTASIAIASPNSGGEYGNEDMYDSLPGRAQIDKSRSIGPNEQKYDCKASIRGTEQNIKASSPNEIIIKILKQDERSGNFKCLSHDRQTEGRASFSYGAFERAYLGLFGWHLNNDKLTEWYIETESNSAVSFAKEQQYNCKVYINRRTDDGTLLVDREGSKLQAVSMTSLFPKIQNGSGYSDFTCIGKGEQIEGEAVFSEGKITRYREKVSSIQH